jgi:capping protein (actin filament) muscle Z-line, beta
MPLSHVSDHTLPIPIALSPSEPGDASGTWDSIHVFEAAERGRQAHYKLTSTIMLQLTTKTGDVTNSADTVSKAKEDGAKHGSGSRDGDIVLSGSMTRQTEQDWPLHDSSSHITNTGRMIEEMEIKMRNLLQEVSAL